MAVEENFPLEQVAPLATAESKSKHNYRPIYSLHKWWARRLGSIFRTIGLSTFAEANDPADVWLLRSGFMKMITHAEIDALSDEGVKPMAEVAKHIPQGVIKRISFKNENELVFGAEKSYLERMHKSTGGWETLINSLLDSGLIMTGAWPLYTEMKSRLRAKEWGRIRGFIRKEKEFVRVLGPQERKPDDLKNPSELIDVLHGVLLLWEKSKREEMVSLLRDSGYGRGEAFYRVAQAVSETLPIENKEKKLLDGFLAGRERLREEVRKEQVQTRLF